MKRILLFLASSIILLSGCVQTSTKNVEGGQNQNEDQNRKSEFPIVGFVEDFVAAHPNFDSNDITREQADENFLKSFTEVSDSVNLIENIPVKLCALNKDSKGNVMAQFRSWAGPTDFEFPLPVNEVNFDIVGKVDPKYVDRLNENSYYTINGKFIGRIESIPAFEALLGRSTMIYTPLFSVRKDDIWDDRYEVSLGMMYYDIESISDFVNK